MYDVSIHHFIPVDHELASDASTLKITSEMLLSDKYVDYTL
jgi:hypothetical protein